MKYTILWQILSPLKKVIFNDFACTRLQVTSPSCGVYPTFALWHNFFNFFFFPARTVLESFHKQWVLLRVTFLKACVKNISI